MKKIMVTVYRASDGTFWCHSEDDVYGCGLNSAGTTVKEAKEDLMVCLDEARTYFEEKGGKAYPVEFQYQYDLQSFFEYFSFLNVSEIGKRAGINPSLMRQYVRGIKHAREKNYRKVATCIESISKDLAAASFCV